MEKYRPSLNICKRLKEAGFPQEDCDMYYNFEEATGEEYLGSYCEYESHYAAPCASRLMEELPESLEKENYVYYLEVEKRLLNNSVLYAAGYWFFDQDGSPLSSCFLMKETLAECLAEMWIKLKEKGLINN